MIDAFKNYNRGSTDSRLYPAKYSTLTLKDESELQSWIIYILPFIKASADFEGYSRSLIDGDNMHETLIGNYCVE